MPPDVVTAMFVAAWARAEHCPVYIDRHELDLYRRYEPSEELLAAWHSSRALVNASLGFAVPIMRVPGGAGRAFAAWPPTYAVIGELGRN